MQALAFHTTQFEIIDRNSQPWVRANQIGLALDYKNPELSIAKLYRSNAGEFTSNMTALIELDTAGGKQQVRIFSLRGAHLLAMFARTKVAAEFRRWVLDVLEGITEALVKTKHQAKALPNGLAIEQQDTIKSLVKARAEALPEKCRAKATITCWSALKTKFGVSYKSIPPEHFIDAVSLVARLPLEGELLDRELPLAAEVKVNWPASRWLAESSKPVRERMTLMQGVGSMMVTPDMLFGPPDEFISPSLKAIAELERLGHNLEACRLEVLAMKHHLEEAHHLFEGVRLWAEQTQGRGIRLKIQR